MEIVNPKAGQVKFSSGPEKKGKVILKAFFSTQIFFN